jgi:hypothetical protein
MASCTRCNDTGYMKASGLHCEPCYTEIVVPQPMECGPCKRGETGPALHICGK